ncbi:MAG: hypothetical protein ACR2HM_10095 [Acidimicrobiales bacterium]
MGQQKNEPELHVVAGCLFEVSFPEREGVSWRWAGGQPEVTYLGESVRGARRHFRFRAEATAAGAGTVGLRFRTETEERGRLTRVMAVDVAPEELPAI